jgi:beta-N-acetylhexosaminidase
VLDRYNFDSAVIGDRAFAESPQEIVQHARNFIRGLTQAGMAAIGKHFPGHGGIVEDTHRQVAIDERSFEEIAASDLFPFAQLAGELQGIMPAHVIFPCLSDLPAGFSNEWLKGILREQLAFKGTIFSDDLSMMAAQIAGGPLERGLAALKAGCSMVLLCNQAKDAIALIEGFEALGVEVEDHHIGQLSALHRRQQSGFNWRNLHATAFWKDTQKSLSALNDRI